MDPVTHTLVGASLAATRLGARTRYAAPALVIGANLPDVDVLSYFAGGDFALGFRRGWTHGVLALVVLPALLALVFLLWERLRRDRGGANRPLAVGWLFGLCYLATLTHPVLDWLNTYGMRWWMPFSDKWYYGDSVFIMDPWLWLILPCRGPCTQLLASDSRSLVSTAARSSRQAGSGRDVDPQNRHRWSHGG
jgi:inner membrane protein